MRAVRPFLPLVWRAIAGAMFGAGLSSLASAEVQGTGPSSFGPSAFELFGFSKEFVDLVAAQLAGLARLGHERKLGQARFVARRRA